MDDPLRRRAAELDAADPLAHLRDRFRLDPGVRAYLDGNSLGRPLASVTQRWEAVTDQWAGRLIRGWDEEWLGLPEQLGDALGRACLGAAPGQVVVADSTSVVLHKLLHAGLSLRPDRDEVVVLSDDFPTDRFLVARVAADRGRRLRWIDTPVDGGVEVEQVSEAVGPRTALVLLSHVAYRSGHLADLAAITEVAHEVGALVLADLSHAVGSVPLELDGWGVDLAAGCTYKYLCGGPGSPAFGYVRAELLPGIDQPITGWMGAADPFAMGPVHEPAASIRRLLSGTPPVLAMQPLRDVVALVEEVGIAALRARSVALTSLAVQAYDALLAPLGAVLASPRDPARRGSHVTVEHPAAREAVALAWQRDVVPDFRTPSGIRLGLAPLTTSFAEVVDGVEVLAECLREVG